MKPVVKLRHTAAEDGSVFGTSRQARASPSMTHGKSAFSTTIRIRICGVIWINLGSPGMRPQCRRLRCRARPAGGCTFGNRPGWRSRWSRQASPPEPPSRATGRRWVSPALPQVAAPPAYPGPCSPPAGSGR